MAIVDITESRKAVQYTGSNSAEIDSAITDLTIDSEVAGVLTVTSSGSQYVVNTNDWVLFWQGVITHVFPNSSVNNFYIQHPTGTGLASSVTTMQGQITTMQGQITTMQGQITTLQSSLSGLSTVAVRSAGVQTAPTLLLGIAQNVDVTLLPAMPNTSFTPYAYAFGAVNLSGLTINSVTVLSASVVRVNVQTSLASLGGAHIMVVVRA